jgi:hypothetical protein
MAKGPQDVKHQGGLNSIAKPMPKGEGKTKKVGMTSSMPKEWTKKLDIASHDEPCCDV